MSNESAKVEVEKHLLAWFIHISGDLTLNEIELLAPAKVWSLSAETPLDVAKEADAGSIVFDLSALEYCNSAGIAVLIRYVREAQSHGYKLAAFGVSPHYQKIFRIVGLTQYLELFPDKYSVTHTLQARAEYGE